MDELSLRRTMTCLGCDRDVPNAAPDMVMCLSCLTELDETDPELSGGPAAPRGPGPDDEHAGDLT